MRKVVIAGAAGRDFHNFNVVCRQNAAARVVAFTAAQIPGIAGRRYPAELAGPGYPEGIAIFPESELEAKIRELAVDRVVFAYSDVSHDHIMERAAAAVAAGAEFTLPSAEKLMLASRVPVISICAVRVAGSSTGAMWAMRPEKCSPG